MRTSQSQRRVCASLTVTSFSKRFGTGAFDYDFGALDEKDNQLTQSYMNVMYDHLYRTPTTPTTPTLTACHVL